MAILSNDGTYVTVVKGDTLSEIAEQYADRIAGTGIYGTNGKLATLVELNDITNSNYIVVGQKIKLTGSKTKSTNNTSKAIIKAFGLQSNTNRSVYATWTWTKTNTDNYRVVWQYDSGNGVWFNGEDSTTTSKQSIYSAPENALRVRFKVLPVSKKRKVNGKETSYWTASWSTIKQYAFSANPPEVPTSFDTEIKDGTLTVTLDNLDVNATHIEFQVIRNNSTVYKTGKAAIKTAHASFSCTVDSGSEYKVRCRAVRGTLYSDWSDYSDNQKTVAAAPTIKECSLIQQTSNGVTTKSVYLEWTKVNTAETYTIEYATDKAYFDKSDQTTTLNDVTVSTFWSIYGLELGTEYFFRVRAENAAGSSKWSAITSLVLGTVPSAPTTWSSTTTAIVGEPLTLYWVHNSEDGSAPTKSKIEFKISTLGSDGNEKSYTYIFEPDHGTGEVDVTEPEEEDDDDDGGILGDLIDIDISTITSAFTPSGTTDNSGEKRTASSYVVQTSNFPEGATIQWSVKTQGIKEEGYSEASITRTIHVYARPSIALGATNADGVLLYTFESFPMYVRGIVGPKTQSAIGYHLSVISDSDYTTVDDVGNVKNIVAGEEIYSKYFDSVTDLSEDEEPLYDTAYKTADEDFFVVLSAGNIDLENNGQYTLKCVVAMNSGLTAEAEYEFAIEWSDEQYEPNAEIFIDSESVSASIRPFCEDENGDPIEDVLLSVYRREFNGAFVELAKDIPNTSYTFITDPHPALDYARYRIVAKSITTGGISYYDVPGYPVNETSAIIQWDEAWSNFDVSSENLTPEDIATPLAEPLWSGSLLRLKYNIDVSDSYKQDATQVAYIGRKHPVSYYGTQTGETSSWSVAIPKDDKETLYAIRRLAVWMGDVYVREPSGSGYWASVNVSFSQTHCELTIPVSISITRVEGGV